MLHNPILTVQPDRRVRCRGAEQREITATAWGQSSGLRVLWGGIRDPANVDTSTDDMQVLGTILWRTYCVGRLQQDHIQVIRCLNLSTGDVEAGGSLCFT